MTNRRLFLLALLGGIAWGLVGDLLGAQPNAAQDTAKARAIVQRHIDAIGGAAAFRKGPVHMVMSMTMSGSEAVIRIETWRDGRRMYNRIEVPGMGTTEMGSDGKTAWVTSPQFGAMILDSLPKDVMAAQNNASELTGVPMRYIGEREIAGRRYEAVELVQQGTKSTAYFDPGSGLMAGMSPEKTPAPPGQMSISFGEWKRLGPMLQLMRFTTRTADGRELVTRVEGISTDPIDAKVFELPATVRELKAKRS